MVFTGMRKLTHLLGLMLRNLGLRAIPISGQISQAKKLGALNKFKAGECNILVCTDVASRGLDIPTVDLVINYDIAYNPKVYMHRVGKTARAGRIGVAISLISPTEVVWFLQIEKHMDKQIPLFPAQEEALLLLECVSEAKRISEMQFGFGTCSIAVLLSRKSKKKQVARRRKEEEMRVRKKWRDI